MDQLDQLFALHKEKVRIKRQIAELKAEKQVIKNKKAEVSKRVTQLFLKRAKAAREAKPILSTMPATYGSIPGTSEALLMPAPPTPKVSRSTPSDMEESPMSPLWSPEWQECLELLKVLPEEDVGSVEEEGEASPITALGQDSRASFSMRWTDGNYLSYASCVV